MALTLDGVYDHALVTNRITGELGIALSLKGRLQLGVSFPVTLTQNGEPLDLMPLEVDNMPVNPPEQISGTGLEDLRISLKGVFWQRGPYGVGAIEGETAPARLGAGAEREYGPGEEPRPPEGEPTGSAHGELL